MISTGRVSPWGLGGGSWGRPLSQGSGRFQTCQFGRVPLFVFSESRAYALTTRATKNLQNFLARGRNVAILDPSNATRTTRGAKQTRSKQTIKMKNHKWSQQNVLGVTGGSGRPHGIDTWQTCERCGCSRGSGPQSTHTGARVIRRWCRDADGYVVDRLPACG